MPRCDRLELDRRRLQLATAPGRTIRLGVHRHDFARARAAARSEGTANSGVPAKTIRSAIRRRLRQSSSGQSLLLGQLLAHHLALERRQVVDEHLAVQVIHLVLDAHREQAVGGELEGFAVAIERLDRDRVGAGDVGVDAGHRQAAFLVDLAALACSRSRD